jgi:hypothetical protein
MAITRDQLKEGVRYVVNCTDHYEFKKGEVITLKRDDGSDKPWFWNPDKSDYYCINLKYIDLMKKTLDNLLEGDIVRDRDGDEVKVLFVLRTGLYVMSLYDSFDQAGQICTSEELKDNGYSVGGGEAADMTVEEVSRALGKTVRIVKSES